MAISKKQINDMKKSMYTGEAYWHSNDYGVFDILVKDQTNQFGEKRKLIEICFSPHRSSLKKHIATLIYQDGLYGDEHIPEDQRISSLVFNFLINLQDEETGSYDDWLQGMVDDLEEISEEYGYNEECMCEKCLEEQDNKPNLRLIQGMLGTENRTSKKHKENPFLTKEQEAQKAHPEKTKAVLKEMITWFSKDQNVAYIHETQSPLFQVNAETCLFSKDFIVLGTKDINKREYYNELSQFFKAYKVKTNENMNHKIIFGDGDELWIYLYFG